MNEEDGFNLLVWIVNKLGAATLLTWMLVGLVFISIISGLTAIIRGLDPILLWSVAFPALIVAWIVARTRWRSSISLVLIAVVGILFAMVRVGNLGGYIADLIYALNDLVTGYRYMYPGLPTPDPTMAITTLVEFTTRSLTLWSRLWAWVVALWKAVPVFDPVASAMIWSLAIWGTSGWAGWQIRRKHNTLLAFLPASGLYCASLAVVHGPTYYILLLFAVTLLMMALECYQATEKNWQSKNIDYSEDLRFDIAIAVMPIVFLVTFVAASSPLISIRKFVNLANQIVESPAPNVVAHTSPVQGPAPQKSPLQPDLIGKSLGLEARPTPQKPGVLQTSLSAGLPQEHLIGSGPELSKKPVMTIRVDQSPSESQDSVASRQTPHYYWRDLTYDHYTGSGWASSPTVSINYQAGVPAQTETLPAQQVVWQEVRFQENQPGLVFAAGDLVRLEQDYQVAWRLQPGSQQSEEQVPYGDIFGASMEKSSYRAESLIPMPSAIQLRQAGLNYPGWISDHYLQLPESVPRRVLDLARDLTATEPTPYDRALAIESYLRRFPYTLDLPEPPERRDIVDYFLFDLEKGYCDYYASAMVVMARAAGLPARLAIGYASGRYEPQSESYLVSEADAHSWPEVFFPGYGWVGFEPTAGRPALDRPGVAEAAVPPDINAGISSETLRPKISWQSLLAIAAFLFLSGLVTGIVWITIDWLRLIQLSPQLAIQDVYRRLFRQGELMKVPLSAGMTPIEFTILFSTLLEEFSSQRSWGGFISPAGAEIQKIAEIYSRSIYSTNIPGSDEKQHAIRAWRRLRARLLLARF
jgi:transglutaminase-like putative cysteine protease